MNAAPSEMKVELWHITRLTPYAKNAKVHDEANVNKICESIKKYGFNSPIQVKADGTIVCGHGRRLAAIKLGMTHVPVHVLHHIKTDAEADAYRLVDNQVAIGKVDADLLGEELRRLTLEMDYNMGDFFSANELKFAFDDVGEIELDAITDDLSAEVDNFADRTANKLTKDKGRKVAIGEALGFKEISAEQRRLVARLMTLLHVQYPSKSPLEAFMAMAQDYMEQTK